MGLDDKQDSLKKDHIVKSILKSVEPSVPKNKVIKSNPKFDELKENNKYNLQKELICRLMTPSFYAFILILCIVIGAIASLFKMSFTDSIDFWNVIIPLLTTYLGYAIGKSSTNSD